MLPRQTMRTLGGDSDMFGGLVVNGMGCQRSRSDDILGGNSDILPHTSNHGLSPHSSLSDNDSVAAGSATASRVYHARVASEEYHIQFV